MDLDGAGLAVRAGGNRTKHVSTITDVASGRSQYLDVEAVVCSALFHTYLKPLSTMGRFI